MPTIRIKVNAGSLPNFRQGEVVVVPSDDEGTPLDQYWRRRLKDAKVDNCCEVVTESEPEQEREPKPQSKSQYRRLKIQRSEKS